MTDLREVAAFLLGEGELDGVGFGDPHPTERGNYWWRKHLRAALAQQDHLAGKRKMVAQPEPEELGEVIPADEEQLKRIAKLVEPEQEPVACPYCHYSHTLGAVFFDQNCAGCVNRMTTPPQREWQGLTDEEMFSLWVKCPAETEDRFAFARAIEAKLKEKNNG